MDWGGDERCDEVGGAAGEEYIGVLVGEEAVAVVLEFADDAAYGSRAEGRGGVVAPAGDWAVGLDEGEGLCEVVEGLEADEDAGGDVAADVVAVGGDDVVCYGGAHVDDERLAPGGELPCAGGCGYAVGAEGGGGGIIDGEGHGGECVEYDDLSGERGEEAACVVFVAAADRAEYEGVDGCVAVDEVAYVVEGGVAEGDHFCQVVAVPQAELCG